MTSSVLFVLHRAQSSPGRIAHRLAGLGYALDMRRPALGEPLPDDLRPYAGAIVFGGPMSANDDAPFIRAERALIARALKEETPYLGICLGAQLLARELGGRVFGHPRGAVEIGFHPVAPTAEGRAFFARPMHVYQWHREGFDLPPGATLLARGTLFENQLFRYGRAFGMQFHAEVTREIMCRWLGEHRAGFEAPGAQHGIAQHLGRLWHGPALGRWLDGFLSQWLGHAPGPSR